YNYYRSVYSSLNEEEDIRIHAVVYLALEMMAKTGDTYLVYTGGAWDEKAQDNIKDVNDIAKKYDLQVYNLDLKLDGGVSAAETADKYTKETMTDGTVLNYAENLYLNSGKLTSGKTKKLYDAMIANGFDTDGDDKIDEATLFAVKGGKVVKPGEIVAAGTDAESMELAVKAGALRKPSFAAGSKDGKYADEGFDFTSIKAFDYFGDNRLHMTEEEGVDQFDGVDSVYEVITLHGFLDILKNCKGDFAVFFGGAWCGNTQAIATLTNDAAKGCGVERVFFYDPNLDGSSATAGGMNTRTSNYKPVYENGVATEKVAEYWKDYRNPSRAGSALTLDSAVFSGLYAKLVDSISAGGQAYQSYWNEGLNTLNHTLWINGKSYSRMCVPNIMAFKAQESGSAKLVNWKEAEYYWANTGVEGNPYREAWMDASIEIMGENDYAGKYVAPVVVPETAPETGNGGSTGGSTGGSEGGC
ncbi:MAG: hypothetical protein IKA90_02330, partial [Clostridia bacterium]|nr:hypothetical protein [Clostridia bacterium]